MEASATSARPSSLHAPSQLLLVMFLLLALLLSPLAVTVARARPTALIVFGDSTVDAGNNNFWPTVARCNYPPYGRDFPGGRATGRWCNGRLFTDFYSEALGLGRNFVPAYLDPAYSIQDFAIGVCFASAGSGIDDATSNIFRVIPLGKQVEMFREYKTRLAAQLGAAKAEAVVSGAVYAISIGSNDYLENYFSMASSRILQYTVPQYTAYLIGLTRSFLTTLHSLGARKVVFTELGNLGCLPADRVRFAGLVCDEMHNAALQSFNVAVRDLMAQLRGQLPGADFRVSDLFGLYQDMVRAPAKYGFSRSDRGCCGNGYVAGFMCALIPACPDANAYMFWDAAHMTEHTNRIVSAYHMNTTYASFRA